MLPKFLLIGFYFTGLTVSIVAGKLTNRLFEKVWQNSLSLQEAECKSRKHISDLLLTVMEAGGICHIPQNKPVDLEARMKLTISSLLPYTGKGWLTGIEKDLVWGEGIKSEMFPPVSSLLLGRRKCLLGCLPLPGTRVKLPALGCCRAGRYWAISSQWFLKILLLN